MELKERVEQREVIVREEDADPSPTNSGGILDGYLMINPKNAESQ
jgi:hypothetical protein